MTGCLLFIVHDLRDGRATTDPILERYAGLYRGVAARLWGHWDSVFYVCSEGRVAPGPGVDGIPVATNLQFLGLAWRLLRQRGRLVVVVPYPWAYSFTRFLSIARARRGRAARPRPPVDHSYSLFLCLCILRLFGARIVFDLIDIPSSLWLQSRRSPGFWTHHAMCWLYSRLADRVLVDGEEARGWLARTYRIPAMKTATIPMGVFPEFIGLEDGKPADEVRIVYLGAVARMRGIDELVRCAANLRNAGHKVRLILAGTIDPAFRWEDEGLSRAPWLDCTGTVTPDQWLPILRRSHIAVIPYPKSRWDRVFVTKLAAYMAAGLPTASTDLRETARILSEWGCGLVARDWAEMETILGRLAADPLLRDELGRRALPAATERYNWEVQSRRFAEIVTHIPARDGEERPHDPGL